MQEPLRPLAGSFLMQRRLTDSRGNWYLGSGLTRLSGQKKQIQVMERIMFPFSLIPSGKGTWLACDATKCPSAVIFALLHSGSEVWGRENLTYEERGRRCGGLKGGCLHCVPFWKENKIVFRIFIAPASRLGVASLPPRCRCRPCCLCRVLCVSSCRVKGRASVPGCE